jgi:hypothetical protein
VICCYLVERCGLSPTAAMESFAYSREGGINHEEFREELLARYSAAAEAAPIQQFHPAWHTDTRPSSDETVHPPPPPKAHRNGVAITAAAQITKRCQRVKLSASHNDLEGIGRVPSDILAIGDLSSAVNSNAVDWDDSVA